MDFEFYPALTTWALVHTNSCS